MPRKTVFDQVKVMDTAFQLVRREGWDGLSARKISAALGSSTMPIYSYLKSVGKVKSGIRKKALELLADFQTKKYTDNPFTNLAVGEVLFARAEKKLFQILYLEFPGRISSQEEKYHAKLVEKILGKPLPFESYFEEIPVEGMRSISFKAGLFVRGLSLSVYSGNLPNMKMEEIVRLLEDAGGSFIDFEKKKNSL